MFDGYTGETVRRKIHQSWQQVMLDSKTLSGNIPNMSSLSGGLNPSRQWTSTQSVAIRWMLLLILALPPWMMGATRPLPIFLLICSVAFLTLLWLWDCVAHDRLNFRLCHITLGLMFILALGLFQLIPMPNWMLRILSPGASSLYEELLPSQHETLNFVTSTESWGGSMWNTLSLYPEATRRWLVYFLAVLLLYQVFRHSMRGLEGVQWFARICVVNGTLLSIFAVLQFFTSPPNVLYWTFPTRGTGFGPFVNRDDFAFYMNICLGAALALLLVRLRQLFVSRQQLFRLNFKTASRVVTGDSRSMWLLLSTAFMMAASISANSRGGFLSLLSGLVLLVGMLAWKWKYLPEIQARKASRLKAEKPHSALDPASLRRSGAALSIGTSMFMLVVMCCMAGGLVAWYGWERIQIRLETLISGTAFMGGRMYVLEHAWPVISAFPIFGTGMGTFESIEPIYFHTADDVSSFYMHAHNDYLEDLLEGGLLRLAARVFVLSFLILSCYRMLGNSKNPTRSALAAGALFSLTTITVHSFFDFALFTPSITVLAVALIAAIQCLATLDEKPDGHRLEHGSKPSPVATPGQMVFSPRGGSRLIVLFIALVLVISMVRKASQEYRVTRILASIASVNRFSDVSQAQTSQLVRAFSQLLDEAPNDASLHADIAGFYLEAYQASNRNPADTTGSTPEDSGLQRTLATGLKHTLTARDLCPIMPEPHVRLAFYHRHLLTSDPRATYLARAKVVAPASEELWFLCGVEELRRGEIQVALASWQNCIALGDQFHQQISNEAREKLTHQQIKRMLPDTPKTILSMVDLIYPAGDREVALERRDLFLQAFQRLPDVSQYTSTADLLDHYAIRVGVGQFDEAASILSVVVRNDPENLEARTKYFRLLIDQNRFPEAREQLTILKAMSHSNRDVEQLSRELTSREIDRRSKRRKNAF